MLYKVLIPEDISQAGKKYLDEKGYEIKMGSGNTVEPISRVLRMKSSAYIINVASERSQKRIDQRSRK